MTAPFTIKCDRYDECQRQMREACERLDCPFRTTHPQIDTRLTFLETRMEKMEKVAEDVSKMRGYIAALVLLGGLVIQIVAKYALPGK